MKIKFKQGIEAPVINIGWPGHTLALRRAEEPFDLDVIADSMIDPVGELKDHWEQPQNITDLKFSIAEVVPARRQQTVRAQASRLWALIEGTGFFEAVTENI
jgi:hypothetical protein